MQRNPICQPYRGAVVNDGTAQFSVKTVCAKEYVDSRFNNEKAIAIPINNNVGTSYINDVQCYKAGHVVTVSFRILKVDKSDSAYASHNTLTGFPKPVHEVFIHVAPFNSNNLLRGIILPDGSFGWHYIPAWKTETGREAMAQVTYLTND